MDFSQFDVRKYPTVSVQEGYREWAQTPLEPLPEPADQLCFGLAEGETQ